MFATSDASHLFGTSDRPELIADGYEPLNGISEAYREVVVMIELLGFSYEEVSAALEIFVGTIRSRMNRGRQLLQSILWQNAEDASIRNRNFRRTFCLDKRMTKTSLRIQAPALLSEMRGFILRGGFDRLIFSDRYRGQGALFMIKKLRLGCVFDDMSLNRRRYYYSNPKKVKTGRRKTKRLGKRIRGF